MCSASDVRKPEQKLSDLMKRELEVEISPVALKLFIRSYWSRVSGYAHAIHDTDPNRPAEKA